MGYHFVIDEAETEGCIKRGETLMVKLCIDNVGVAPIYTKLPLYLRLKNDQAERTFVTDVDIRKWVEGKYEEVLVCELPADMPMGKYELQVGIGGGNTPSVVFATNAKQDGDCSVLAEIEVK